MQYIPLIPHPIYPHSALEDRRTLNTSSRDSQASTNDLLGQSAGTTMETTKSDSTKNLSGESAVNNRKQINDLISKDPTAKRANEIVDLYNQLVKKMETPTEVIIKQLAETLAKPFAGPDARYEIVQQFPPGAGVKIIQEFVATHPEMYTSYLQALRDKTNENLQPESEIRRIISKLHQLQLPNKELKAATKSKIDGAVVSILRQLNQLLKPWTKFPSLAFKTLKENFSDLQYAVVPRQAAQKGQVKVGGDTIRDAASGTELPPSVLTDEQTS